MKATATTLITGILLLTAAGCSSSGSISGSGGAKNSPGGAGTKTGVSAPEGAAPSGGGDNHVATPKTAVEAFMNAVKKGDMAAVATATCQDMKDEVANNLNGLTLQSFSAEAPYQMEDHWVVSTTFSDTQNGAPFQGKVDYQVVKDGDTYKWCGLDVPFGAPKGTPGIDPSQTKS